MATLTIPNSFTGLTTIRSADMNANFQAVATFLNSTKLDGTNLQTAVADASTIELASNVLRVKDAGITRAKLAAVGQQLSAASGDFTASAITSTFADIANMTVTITTTGRPVWMGLVSDGSAGTFGSFVNFTSNSAANQAFFRILRGSTEIARMQLQYGIPSGTSGFTLPPGVIWHIDPPAAGTYTYKVQYAKYVNSGTMAVEVDACKFIAYEIG